MIVSKTERILNCVETERQNLTLEIRTNKIRKTLKLYSSGPFKSTLLTVCKISYGKELIATVDEESGENKTKTRPLVCFKEAAFRVLPCTMY